MNAEPKLNPNAKILVLDIEWRPAKAYVWQPWKENIHPEKIIEDGGLLCVGLKWLGEKECKLFSEWEHGHRGMLEMAHRIMAEADAIVTYNGDKYDLPKLNGEFVLHGLPPLPPIASIDCIKAVKKFGFFMNRLAFVGPFLNIDKKMEHEGFGLWRKVMDGDASAQKRMSKYCKQDVVLLEKLYLRIRPYIRNHPHLGGGGIESCGSCGSKHLQKRGFRFTRAFRIQRQQCQSCGQWQDGTRSKI